MSKNSTLARHRAASVRTNPLKALSKAVSSNAGSVGRPAAAIVAASGLMLGFGAPANASVQGQEEASVSAATQQQANAAAGASAEQASAKSETAAKTSTHTVKSGDTLGKIAAQYGVSLQGVFSANGLGMDSVIYPGEKIKLSGTAAAEATGEAASDEAASYEAAGSYTVKSGDTLGKIAAKHGVSLDTVLALNGMGVNSVIYPGDSVQLSGEVTAAVTASAAAAPAPAAPSAPTASVNTASADAGAAESGVSLASSGAVQEIAPQAASAPAPAEASAGNVGAALVNSAYSQVGIGQDCTAMVEKALRSVGKSVGDIAPEHFYRYGSVVGSPAPGDLVISAGHVGIYVGDGNVVSGGFNGNQTIEHPLSYLDGYSFVRVG